MMLVLISTLLSLAQNMTGTIDINQGATLTSDREGFVLLRLNAPGAAQMRVSNNGSFIGARWEVYERRKNWRIDAREDGIKTVYAQFRDASRTVISEAAIAQIILDRQPPIEADILISAGQEYTNSEDRKVFLELYAKDAATMRISSRPDFARSKWFPYKERLDGWKLSPSDGVKRIFAEFKDRAGNVSMIVVDTIVYDRTAPQKTRIRINKDDYFTKTLGVNLELYAKGATEMLIRNVSVDHKDGENIEGGDWQPFQTTLPFTVTPGVGPKIIAVKFRDAVGNESKPTGDKIFLDDIAPEAPRVRVNSGNRYTQNYNVNLKLAAIGAYQMMVSNHEDFRGAIWQAYSILLPNWAINPEEGEHTVYVKFRDRAGNISKKVDDDIILDKTPPKDCKLKIITKEGIEGITNNADKLVNLQIKAESARYMMLSNISTFYDGRWEIYREEYKDWHLGDGEDSERLVYIKFRDRAGNVSKLVYDKVTYDSRAPVNGKIAINRGLRYCTNPSVKISMFAQGADHVFLYNGKDSTSGKWQPYKEVIAWELDKNANEHTVSVKFRDHAGNVSKIYSDGIILDTAPPYDLAMSINKGDSITNNPNKRVLLKVRATNAYEMLIGGTPTFRGARWRNYSALNITYTLPGNDGLKEIFAVFRDSAGNVSDTISTKIILDRTPPVIGTVAINEGNGGTNRQKVTLNLAATGAVKMMLGNTVDFIGGQWEPFKTTRNWVLVGQNGLKTIFVRFKDAAGNQSKIAFDRIGFDNTAPSEGIVHLNLRKNRKYCTDVNKYVNLYIRSRGATKMAISNNPQFDSARWQPYRVLLQDWILEGDDGDKTVYVKFKDNFGNATKPISASIILDRQEPIDEELIIEDGHPYTTKHMVKLNLEAEGATKMKISNRRSFSTPSKWEAYKPLKEWALTGRDGIKTIYAKFSDDAGNKSFVVSAQILLDTTPPIPGHMKINGKNVETSSSQVSLSFNARKEPAFMMVSNNPKFEGAIWQEYTTKMNWILADGSGYKRVYTKFKDKVGNVCRPIFAEITLSSY